MPSLNTQYHGYAVKFSPLDETRLAVAAHNPHFIADHGPLRHGRLLILNATPFSVTNINTYNFYLALNECAWSNFDPNIIVAGDCRGSVMVLKLSDRPNFVFTAPGKSSKISSIDWNPINSNDFLTSGGNADVKLWNLGKGNHPIIYSFGDDQTIYSSIWKPKDANIFACAGLGILGIMDTRMKRFVSIPGSPQYFRDCDWCKNNDNYIATASEFDGRILTWDIRHTANPYTVRRIELDRVIRTGRRRLMIQKVKFLPGEAHQIASCSKDSVVLWNYGVGVRLIDEYFYHAGPVLGLDVSPHIEGLMASTGRDGLVHVWKNTKASSL